MTSVPNRAVLSMRCRTLTFTVDAAGEVTARDQHGRVYRVKLELLPEPPRSDP